MIMLRQLVIINENPARFFLISILISGILPNSVQSEIRQLILENNAHMQCHTRVKSSCIGSINSSFLFKSADCLNKIGLKSSHFGCYCYEITVKLTYIKFLPAVSQKWFRRTRLPAIPLEQSSMPV